MKIHTIGGYSEVGKNMTAIEVDGDVFIFDAGFYLPAIVGIVEQDVRESEKKMRHIGAIPDDIVLDKLGLRDKVRGIFIGHAHLDHVGAIPYIADRYRCPIYATPFTLAVLQSILEDDKKRINNKIITVNPNSSFIVKGKNRNYQVDFINITHSTLQTTMIALHTPEGVVLYANDFKFDNNPILGLPPNYKKLEELGKKGVKVLIVDSLYADDDRKTPSEKIARGLLEDVLLTTTNKDALIIVTTFSSHIARLKSIVDFGKRLNRRIVFLGRSLNKYVSAAIKIKSCPFSKDIALYKYRKQVNSILKRINTERKKYLVVCTGHQGEEGSILDRIAKNETPLQLSPQDHIIFSSKIIPTEITIANRAQLERRLRHHDVRIFGDAHVSVMPDTEVVFNGEKGMKIKEIGAINKSEEKNLRVPSFDPTDLKIRWFPAKLIKHNYKGKIFNIQTKSGRKVAVTSGHSLFKLEETGIVPEIGDKLKEGDYLAIPKKFSWYKKLEEIDIEDYISIENKNYKKENGFLEYNNKKICPLKIKLTKEFARLLGYYLAEGSAPRHISLVIGKHENDILKEIKESTQKSFPSNINVYDKGTSYEICFGARTLKRIFKKWFGDNAKTKKIPEFVFSASRDFKLNFLGAYINGDGSIDKGKKHFRIRIKTASKKLASDLLYLLSQVGICAKFDHIEKNKRRKIAGNKKFTGETFSYVIRLQGVNSLLTIKDYVSEKFSIQIEASLKNRRSLQQLPPESLPINKLNLSEIEPKKNNYLWDIKHYNQKCKKKKQHISPELIKEYSSHITGFTNKLLNGELLFDPIVKIEVSNYDGGVYDFEVPGTENFVGGFGGIMLHNSGHAGREDLRDFINMTKPKHIFPAHVGFAKQSALAELASEIGYKVGTNCHMTQDGQTTNIKN